MHHGHLGFGGCKYANTDGGRGGKRHTRDTVVTFSAASLQVNPVGYRCFCCVGAVAMVERCGSKV